MHARDARTSILRDQTDSISELLARQLAPLPNGRVLIRNNRFCAGDGGRAEAGDFLRIQASKWDLEHRILPKLQAISNHQYRRIGEIRRALQVR